MKLSREIAVVFAVLAAGAGLAFGQGSPTPAIIPLPQKFEVNSGTFPMRSGTRVFATRGCAETAQYLTGELKRRAGVKLTVRTGSEEKPGSILLTTNGAALDLGDEGYELAVTHDRVVIQARTPAGLFYGVQSLLQLLPLRVANQAGCAVPCVKVEDRPRFKWRGLMLDVSRHFFTKPEIETLLDEMASHKLNVFHWHLADDQGWRIEIKKYPLLTKMGAWRKSIGFGLETNASSAYGPDGRYGGFYTQRDIRDVVAYASARHIMIVPEIEMPGHSSAALMAYPQFSCTGGPFSADLPGGVFNGVYCAGNDETFTFLQNVLTEVFQLFPGPYVHIGGDEVLTNNWAACPKCQARMRELGLEKPGELEGYFIRRMEKFINARHRNLIGWSEIREGGLAANATVMDWVGGAVEAAAAGHDVVMSPLADCYFDHYQSLNQAGEPHAIGGYLPLSQVYAYEPIPTNLPPQFQDHILGAQANVWTEYMPNFKHVEYMVFPRLCALAEVDWSPKESRNWDDFNRRVKDDCTRLESQGINFRQLK